MDLKERIEELGYHCSSNDYSMCIYKHGDFVVRFSRFDKRDKWKQVGTWREITISNVEAKLEYAEYVRND